MQGNSITNAFQLDSFHCKPLRFDQSRLVRCHMVYLCTNLARFSVHNHVYTSFLCFCPQYRTKWINLPARCSLLHSSDNLGFYRDPHGTYFDLCLFLIQTQVCIYHKVYSSALRNCNLALSWLLPLVCHLRLPRTSILSEQSSHDPCISDKFSDTNC